jgi:hypothetical protein
MTATIDRAALVRTNRDVQLDAATRYILAATAGSRSFRCTKPEQHGVIAATGIFICPA